MMMFTLHCRVFVGIATGTPLAEHRIVLLVHCHTPVAKPHIILLVHLIPFLSPDVLPRETGDYRSLDRYPSGFFPESSFLVQQCSPDDITLVPHYDTPRTWLGHSSGGGYDRCLFVCRFFTSSAIYVILRSHDLWYHDKSDLWLC